MSGTAVGRNVLVRPLSPLSPRQLDVLRLSAEGLSSEEIGVRLGLTNQTIKTYRSRILDRLSAASTTHAVAVAFRRGLLA